MIPIRLHTRLARTGSILWSIPLTVVLLCAPHRVHSQGDGGTQSVFSIGAGSRAISLGRAFVPIADDASALYWNPAALTNVRDSQIMGMYMPLFGGFADASYTYFGAVWPTLNAGSIGFGFQRVSSSFDGFDEFSVPTGEEHYSETQLLFGYGFERESRYLFGSMAAGINFKIANQKISSLSSTSPGIDLGFQYRPEAMKNLSFAVNLQDIVGPSHKLDVADDKTYRTMLAGIGYTHPLRDGSALRVILQLDLPQKADQSFHAGAEYQFRQIGMLRIGMDDGNLSFGMGVTVRRFGLDYAMLSRDTAGSSQPMTFTAHFGKTLHEQRNVIAQRQADFERDLIRVAFVNRVKEHRERAISHEGQGNIPAALDEWKIVLEFEPSDSQATGHVADLTDYLLAEQQKHIGNIEKRATISAHFAQGLAHYQANEYVAARREWMTVVEMDSTHAEALTYQVRTQKKITELVEVQTTRARDLEMELRYTEAIGEWNNIQVLDPGNEKAQTAIRRIEGVIQNQSNAAKRLEIVELYQKALTQFNDGNFLGAMVSLSVLMRLEPDHEDAKTLRFMAQRKLTPLTEKEEAQIRRLYLQGMRFYSNNEYTLAIAEWEKILTIDPTNESVRRNIKEAKVRLSQLGSN